MRKQICSQVFLGFILVALMVLLAQISYAEEFCIGIHETIHVNGVDIYLEIAGEGKPVILLHGNNGSHMELCYETRQLVNAGYKVYAMDSRGQGENEPLDEYHYADMAEDVYALIEHYKLDKPALYGWSDGGIVAIELVLHHPDSISMMAISGANIYPEGIIDLEQDMDVFNPLDYLILTEPQHRPEELEGIDIPVLVTAGSDDIVYERHTRTIDYHLPNSRLIILDGEDHGTYIYESEIMGELLIDFLEENDY